MINLKRFIVEKVEIRDFSILISDLNDSKPSETNGFAGLVNAGLLFPEI